MIINENYYSKFGFHIVADGRQQRVIDHVGNQFRPCCATCGEVVYDGAKLCGKCFDLTVPKTIFNEEYFGPVVDGRQGDGYVYGLPNRLFLFDLYVLNSTPIYAVKGSPTDDVWGVGHFEKGVLIVEA